MRLTSSVASVAFAFLLPNIKLLILSPWSRKGLDCAVKNYLLIPGACKNITSASAIWPDASSIKSIMCCSRSLSFSRRICEPTLAMMFLVRSAVSCLPPDLALMTYLLSVLVNIHWVPFITYRQNFPPWHKIKTQVNFSFLKVFKGSNY